MNVRRPVGLIGPAVVISVVLVLLFAFSERPSRDPVVVGGMPGLARDPKDAFPANWKVSLGVAEQVLKFGLLMPKAEAANKDNLVGIFLAPPADGVNLTFPAPNPGAAVRQPWINIGESLWTGGDPLTVFKQDLVDSPAVGKELCYIDDTVAECVIPQSPSDALGNNAANVRVVLGDVEVKISGGDDLLLLRDIASSLKRT